MQVSGCVQKEEGSSSGLSSGSSQLQCVPQALPCLLQGSTAHPLILQALPDLPELLSHSESWSGSLGTPW